MTNTNVPTPSGFELGYAWTSTTNLSLERQLDALSRAGDPGRAVFVDKTDATTDRERLQRCSPTSGSAT